jgi:rod shape-determining protein MreC
VVKLITDEGSAVSATVDATGVSGIVQPAIGSPNDLRLEFVRHADRVKTGQALVTSGTSSSRYPSLFPPGIPIGRVNRVDAQEVDLYQRVHLRPFAELRRLDYVQVLTHPGQGPRA